MFTKEFQHNNNMCCNKLKEIVRGTKAKVYMDEFVLTTDFCATWLRIYNTFLGEGSKDILVTELEDNIANTNYTGLMKGFTFMFYVECHKTTTGRACPGEKC